MLRSIATLCVAGSLPEKLRAIAQAGFDGVEIFEPDFTDWGESPTRLAALCRELGLTIFLYQPLRNIEGAPPEEWPQTRERACRTFETMREMGCRNLLLCSTLQAGSNADPARQTDDLARIADIAASFDARVGYEALAWGVMSTATLRPGNGFRRLIIRRSAWCSTVFMCWRLATRCRLPASHPRRFSLRSLPMRRVRICRWMSGAATTVRIRVKVRCRSPGLPAR